MFAHNHFTRDIKPQGECPGCDYYHVVTTVKNVLQDALYEKGVDHEEASSEAERIIKTLRDSGVDFRLRPKDIT